MEKTPDQNIEDISNKILLTAYNQYRKNIDRVIQYNKEHPDKCRVRQKRNYQNTKNTNPEKYKEMLEKKRLNYINKKEAQKSTSPSHGCTDRPKDPADEESHLRERHPAIVDPHYCGYRVLLCRLLRTHWQGSKHDAWQKQSQNQN